MFKQFSFILFSTFIFFCHDVARAEQRDLLDRGTELRATVKELARGPTALRPVAEQAQGFIDHGDLDGARHILDDAAKSASQAGEQSDAKESYTDAAEHYEQAALLVAGLNDSLRWSYLIKAGEAYFSQTDKRVDDEAAYQSIGAYERALGAVDRKAHPLDWALTHDKIGEAYHRLGAHNDKIAPYLQAYAHFNAALEERRRDVTPSLWAQSKRNVCNTLRDMAELDKTSDKARETMACFRDVLEVYSKERDPLQWSWTQLAIGNAYIDFGPPETRAFRLKKAVEAFKAGLEVCTRERDDQQHAEIEWALGRALMKLGKIDESQALLRESIAALRDSLSVWTRESDPRDWVTSQSDLGDALVALGKTEKGTERFKEALTAYQEALKVWTPDTDADSWSMTRRDIAKTRALIAEREATASSAR